MNAEQILKLVNAVSASDLSELKYEGDGIKLTLKKAEDRKNGRQVPAQAAAPDESICGDSDTAEAAPETAASAAAAPVPSAKAEEKAEPVSGNIIKSPLVGTFYAAPAEDAAPFVKTGDVVEKGQVLAIIEAMKLMNEIESDYAGTVAEILVENGQAVEYGQPLFVIR
ncbi:MAG: acetyl-CoA carboxylase biotin carboxyl carrier protein [Lachnospiraceae bacterium]|nr:acetyl-CoA carboxylase biotin carboxyl carrier protein [Lachnospiraceae bacterium]MDY4970533.1 acetyl-CoA carboxylase biotin carboxyl carrier protein [Lachnospiraceae bacterium]